MEIFGGSFSSVWTATIARVGAFCSIFQTVHDYATETQEFCRPSHQFSKIRQNILHFCKNCTFSLNSVTFRRKFHGFSPEFHRMLEICSKSMKFADFSEIPENAGRKSVQNLEKSRKNFYLKHGRIYVTRSCCVAQLMFPSSRTLTALIDE